MKAKRLLIWLLLSLSLFSIAYGQSYEADKKAGDKALAAQNYSTAIDIFRKLVSDYPNKVEAINALGFALYLNEEFDEAIKSFENALAVAPDDDAAKRNLILAAGRKALDSSYREGLSTIDMLKLRFPGHPQLAILDFYLGKLHFLYGFTHPALEAWKSVARSRPQSGTALFLRAVHANDAGDYASKNKLLGEALKLMPNEEVFRIWGARVFFEANQADQAQKLLAPLEERQALSPGVAIALSRFERMQGQTLAALNLLQKTTQVPEVLLERTLITQQLGASQQAIATELQKALDAGGDGAILLLTDEPGGKVYLDDTLLGSAPIGIYPDRQSHEIRIVFDPYPCLVARVKSPAEGILVLQSGRASGIDSKTHALPEDILLNL